LIQQYVDTGLVRFVHRDLPIIEIHPGAVLAAHVANCAAEQGAFFPMQQRIFASGSAGAWVGGDDADYAVHLGDARQLGLDEAALQACVASNRHAETIAADVQLALDAGVRSTPSFLVNGRLVIGAQPLEFWQSLFEQLLAEE
jgi:protein-disulfide isomerase